MFSTKEKADISYQILERMIGMGADVNAKDSYGVSCLWRFCMEARQILPAYNHVQHQVLEDRILTQELKEDLTRIFCMLLKNGMDLDYIAPNFSCSVKELYGEEPLGVFLGEHYGEKGNTNL